MMNLRQLHQVLQFLQVYVKEIVSSKGPSNKFLKWYEDDTYEEEEEFWFKKPKDNGKGSKSTTSKCLSTPKAREPLTFGVPEQERELVRKGEKKARPQLMLDLPRVSQSRPIRGSSSLMVFAPPSPTAKE
ncbi:hypothetical protein Tco_0590188 [Tanacetum coccineum]